MVTEIYVQQSASSCDPALVIEVQGLRHTDGMAA